MSSTAVIRRQIREIGIVDPPPDHWLALLRTGGHANPLAVLKATFFVWPLPPSPTSSDASASSGYSETGAPLSDEADDDDDDDDSVHGTVALSNVAAAAAFAVSLLRSFDPTMQTFAIAGGLAVIMRGSTRMTEDVDIIFKGPLPQLYRLMLQQER
jgi:hypothetical protein